MMLIAFKVLEQHDKRSYIWFWFCEFVWHWLSSSSESIFCFASNWGYFIYSSQDLKDAGIFCSLSAICSALYPLLCIHPEIHSQIFGNANKLCSPFLINKRPHTTQYFLLYLCSQSCTCISKDNRFVLSKVKCFQAIALALVLPPSRCMNIFPVLLLQIRTCILLNRANKFQTQILETVMRDWQNWIKPK